MVKKWKFGPISISQQFDDINPFLSEGYRYINCKHNNFNNYIVSNNEYVYGLENVSDLNGNPGQNSDNPQSDFSFHEVAKVGNTYYDPSYGGSSYTASSQTNFLSSYEDLNIAGYFMESTLVVDETDETGYGLDLNGVNGKTTNAIVKFMFVKPHIVTNNLPVKLNISNEEPY